MCIKYVGTYSGECRAGNTSYVPKMKQSEIIEKGNKRNKEE